MLSSIVAECNDAVTAMHFIANCISFPATIEIRCKVLPRCYLGMGKWMNATIFRPAYWLALWRNSFTYHSFQSSTSSNINAIAASSQMASSIRIGIHLSSSFHFPSFCVLFSRQIRYLRTRFGLQYHFVPDGRSETDIQLFECRWCMCSSCWRLRNIDGCSFLCGPTRYLRTRELIRAMAGLND